MTPEKKKEKDKEDEKEPEKKEEKAESEKKPEAAEEAEAEPEVAEDGEEGAEAEGSPQAAVEDDDDDFGFGGGGGMSKQEKEEYDKKFDHLQKQIDEIHEKGVKLIEIEEEPIPEEIGVEDVDGSKGSQDSMGKTQIKLGSDTSNKDKMGATGESHLSAHGVTFNKSR